MRFQVASRSVILRLTVASGILSLREASERQPPSATAALADNYHVIAPDYPGYGRHSGMPDRTTFAYTFDRFVELVDGLLGQLGAAQYTMYVMEYGAPVGWRLALKHLDRVTGLSVQNGNAYEEGLKEFWDPIKAYWADGSDAHRQALKGFLTLEATKFQYTDGIAAAAAAAAQGQCLAAGCGRVPA